MLRVSLVGTELYIYWKVSAAQLQPALQATRALQVALQLRHAGLQARLLQRGDDAGTPTLMEIYTLPGGISPGVQQDIEDEAVLRLAPLAPPAVQRHVERFEPI